MKSTKDTECVHPVIENLYGVVWAMYRYGVPEWRNNISDIGKEYIDEVKDDIDRCDFSNLAAWLIAMLNQVNGEIKELENTTREQALAEVLEIVKGMADASSEIGPLFDAGWNECQKNIEVAIKELTKET